MGSGIAATTARSGYPTLLYDPRAIAIENAEKNLQTDLDRLVEKDKITSEERRVTISNIVFSNNIEDCKGDLVIEAIIEDVQAKQELFSTISALNGGETILASNTSSLSVASLASPIPSKERFCGLHFFNPAQVMKLVEIVKTPWTSEEVITITTTFIESLDKVPVLCTDSPGFIVNRVARHYYLESLKLLQDGVADLETIDRVMENAGFRMGPFRLMDLIGNDVNFAVTRSIYEAFGKAERFRPSEIQESKLTKGELGRKTGKGFYKY